MLTIARKRLQKDDEDGFTLIELMVVVLIIAILMAIAIPSFLSAQDRANDRSAQSNMRVGLTNARSIYTDAQVYPSQANLVIALNQAEPNVAYVTHAAGAASEVATVAANTTVTPPIAAKTGAGAVYVKVTGTDTVALTAKSKSGKCFTISDTKGSTSAITETSCTLS